MNYELTPAYGRDYKSAKEAKQAFDAGQDWLGDYQLGFQLVNKPQLPIGSSVILRYRQNTQLTTTNVTTHDLVPIPPTQPKQPSVATMQRWVSNGVAKATDGCQVEPDGHCEHGKPSWLIQLGVI